ncbi:MAG: translocation/assembly module TamB domain-containing protein, partial [Planctomycetota bacterium]
RDEAGLEVSILSVEGSYLTGFRLRDVVVTGLDTRLPQVERLEVREVDVRFDPVDLARNGIEGVSSVRVCGVTAAIDLTARREESPSSGPIEPLPQPTGEGAVAFPAKEEKEWPFHRIPLPPLTAEQIDLNLKGKGFLFAAKGLAVVTAGGGGKDLDAVLSWDAITFAAGERGFETKSAFLKLQKRGAELSAELISTEKGRTLADLAVTLPARLDEGELPGRVDVVLGELGRIRLSGKLDMPPGQGFSVDGSIEGVNLEELARVLDSPLATRGRAERVEFDFRTDSSDLETARGNLKVVLEGPCVPGRCGADSLELSATLRKGLKGSLKASASWGKDGRGEVEFSGGLGGRCSARITAESPDLGPLVPGLSGYPAHGGVYLQGELKGDWPDLRFKGTLRAKGEDLLGVRKADLLVRGLVNRAGFDVERIDAKAAGGRVEGWIRGAFPVGSELAFRSDVDVWDAERMVPSRLAKELGISGSLKGGGEALLRDGQWTLSCDVEARKGAFGNYAADVVEVSVDLAEKNLEVMNFAVRRGERILEVPYFTASFEGGKVEGSLPFAKLLVGREALVSRRPVRFSAGRDSFRLSPMELVGDWARVLLAGELRRDGTLSAMVVGDHILLDRVARLTELDARLKGSVSFDFDVEGTSKQPRLEGKLIGRGLKYANMSPADAEFQGVNYRNGRLLVERAEIWTDAGSLELSETIVPLPLDEVDGVRGGARGFVETFLTSPELDVEARFRDLDLASLTGKDTVRTGAGSGGSIHLRGPLTGPRVDVALTCPRLEVKGVPPCKIDFAAATAGRGISIDKCRAHLPTGILEIQGWIPLASGVRKTAQGRWVFEPLETKGFFRLSGKGRGFVLSKFLEVVKAPKRYRSLEGRGKLGFKVRGTWKNPEIRVEGEIKDFTSPKLDEHGRLNFVARYRRELIELTEFEVDLARGHIEAEGRLPIRLGSDGLTGKLPVLEEGALLQGDLRLSGIQLDPISTYVEGLKRSAGLLEGSGTFSGPVAGPVLNLGLQVSGGALVFDDPALPRLDSVSGRLDLTRRRVDFDITGRTGGGEVTGKGEAALKREGGLERISMTLSGRGRPLLWTGEDLRARADFKLVLDGTPEKGSLTGDVKVFYTTVDLRHDLGIQSTGKRRLVPGFRLPGMRRILMNVSVETPEGLRLKSEIHQRGISLADIDVRMRGLVRLWGDTTQPVLLGNVHTESGSVDLPFYQLNLVTGNLNFLETNPEDPQLHFLAKTIKGDTTIFVTVNGSLSRNDVRFYSEPPMTEPEIQAFLATGVRPEAWRGDQAGETLGVQIATLVAKQISPYIFGRGGGAGAGLLDRVSLSSERDEDTGEARYRAEFRLLKWLWLVGERDEYGSYSGRLKARVGFRSRKPEVGETMVPKDIVDEVEEAPLPFDVVFEGSGSLSESLTLDAVEDDIRRYAEFGKHPSYLEDAASRLETLYRRSGHHHAKVKVSVRKSGEKPSVVFKVFAGQWVHLKRVRFKNNNHFTEEQLDPYFENEKYLLSDQLGKRRFDLREIKRGLSRVESLYRNAGYLNAKVELDPKNGDRGITWSGRGEDTARIVVLITEGPRAFVTAVEIEGTDFSRDEILAALGDPVNKPFSTSMPLTFSNTILDLLANRGHPFCKVDVDPRIDPSETSVSVKVKIDMCPRSRIGRVVPRGNVMTLDAVIRHLAGFDAGDVYRGDEVREATSRLMRSGLFQSVKIEPKRDPDDPNVVHMEVEVTEADDFEVTASIGAGEYEVFGADLKILNRNLLGTGRKAWIRGYLSLGNSPLLREALIDSLGKDEPGEEKAVARPLDYYQFRAGGFEAVYNDPMIFNSPLSTEIKIYAGQRAEITHKIERRGIIIPLTIPLFEKLELKLSYRRDFSRVFDVDAGVDPGKEGAEVSAFQIALSRDGRDDRFNPRWGTRLYVSYMYAGRKLAGTLDFDKAMFRAYAYVSPLGKLFTLSFGGSAAVIDPKLTDKKRSQGGDEEPIPIAWRLYRGGDSSVRSFWYRQLGPIDDNGKPAGGEAFLQFNVELRVPLWKFLSTAFFFEG